MECAIVLQDAEEEHKGEKAHTQSGCPLNEDFFIGIEAKVVNEVPHDVNGNKKYIIHQGNKSDQKWNKLYYEGHNFKLTTSIKTNFKAMRHIGYWLLGGSQQPLP